jgi:hypothetical protein
MGIKQKSTFSGFPLEFIPTCRDGNDVFSRFFTLLVIPAKAGIQEKSSTELH